MLKSNGVYSITRTNAVARAVTCSHDVNYGYGLGSGGRNPKATKPYNKEGKVDCSGAVSWFLGIDRLQIVTVAKEADKHGIIDIEQEELWWSTDSFYDDATGDGPDWFDPIAVNDQILPGDLLVYPDYKVNGSTKQGHVALVTGLLQGFKRRSNDWHKYVLIAHATPGHRKATGNVIAVTDARAFRARKLEDGRVIGGTFIRYKKFAV